MNGLLLPFTCDNARAMYFVDGENLAIRYGAAIKELDASPRHGTIHLPDILVWNPILNRQSHETPYVMRKYYYTSVQGDETKIKDAAAQLKHLGIDTPRVFKRHRDKGSKQVDITLATDMLLHATRKHYEVAVLVAGDEDYIPLVHAVQREGARVSVWFVSKGMNPALKMTADHFVDLDEYLFFIKPKGDPPIV